MIAIHGTCRMCGGLAASIEVDLPHATPEQRKKAGASANSMLATAICRTCARAVNTAWAQHGAGEWARMREEREAAKSGSDE